MYIFVSVDGVWTEWSDWSVCPVTCGGSNHTKERECLGRAHGGEDCEGDNIESKRCGEEPCPGELLIL